MKELTQLMRSNAYFNEIAHKYDSALNNPICQAVDRFVYSRLQKYSTLETLDVGCGTANYIEQVEPLAYIGLDPSGKMLEQANFKRARLAMELTATLIQGDAQALPFAYKTFDFVVSTFASLSYCESPERAISEIARVLRPGGKFFIMLAGHAMDTKAEQDRGVNVRKYNRAEAIELINGKLGAPKLKIEKIYGLLSEFTHGLLKLGFDQLLTESYFTSSMSLKQFNYIIIEGTN
jgi:ubiquinone/menaquinone biosynthesis C-methylase UbiE